MKFNLPTAPVALPIDGFYADPDAVLIDNEVWVIPTTSAEYAQQMHLDAFSSRDLVTWQKHARIFDSPDFPWLKTALWAPALLSHQDKLLLAFAGNNIQSPESPWWDELKDQFPSYGGIGIATASLPPRRFTDHIGAPLVDAVINGAQPIDPHLFYDENGRVLLAYGSWGHANLVRLSEDLKTLEPWEDGTIHREITPPGYFEAPCLFQRQGWWYFMWSEGEWTKSDYRVAYGRSRSLFGPWTREGVVMNRVESLGAGAGHHCVLRLSEHEDQWLMFFHYRPHGLTGWNERKLAMAPLTFESDGSIRPIS